MQVEKVPCSAQVKAMAGRRHADMRVGNTMTADRRYLPEGGRFDAAQVCAEPFWELIEPRQDHVVVGARSARQCRELACWRPGDHGA
jgi:hypothetical protein